MPPMPTHGMMPLQPPMPPQGMPPMPPQGMPPMPPQGMPLQPPMGHAVMPRSPPQPAHRRPTVPVTPPGAAPVRNDAPSINIVQMAQEREGSITLQKMLQRMSADE